MSTTKQYILTDGEKFYTETKELGVLGDGLKSYETEQAAKAASRMIKKYALTPVSLSEAKNGADKAKNDEATQVAPLPDADTALKEKEAEAFSKMLYVAYGHITNDPKVMGKIHNFILSPVGKRIDFNADFIRTLLSDYDDATKDAAIPENKKVLVAEISKLQEELGEYKSLFSDKPEKAQMLEHLIAGVKATISPLQAQLAELPDENEVIFGAVVLLPLCSKLFSEKALKPSARGKNGNGGNAWTMGEGQMLAFDYSSARICQNGVDLSKLNIQSIQGFVYHPDHENIKDLSVPVGKLAVVSHDHVLVGQIDAKQALGNVLGEAIFEIVKPDVDRTKFVQAISSTGVDAFQSKKSALLSKTAKVVSANIVTNGQHSELETVGNQTDTEKEHAPMVE